MNKILEIRWHGRGGQGAKTAALLFGEAAMATGKYLQAFPEYGPERMGAPVQAFNRLSDSPIPLHCGVKEPDFVVVLDPTLMESQPITAGLKPDGTILINTTLSPDAIKEKLGLKTQKVCTVDASGISRKYLGRELPNTPMLGALIKVLQVSDAIPINRDEPVISLDDLLKDTHKKLEKKFRGKEKVIEGNLESMKKAYEEVKTDGHG